MEIDNLPTAFQCVSVELKLLEMSTRNVAVVVGQPSIIICQFISTVNISALHFTPLSSSKEPKIWSTEVGIDNNNFSDPFTVFKDRSSFTLYLNSTSLNSAGSFTWKATIQILGKFQLIKSIGQLIVLGKSLCHRMITNFTIDNNLTS